VIITSNALPAGQTSVLGGAHGTTTTLADAYGSTDGNPGAVRTATLGAIPGSSSGAECLPVLTVAKSTSTPNVTNTSAGTVATYSITVSNAAGTGAATGVSVSDALPAGFTYATTVSIGLNGGATRPSAVNPTLGDTNPTFGTFSIPGAGSVVITFTVNIASTVPTGTYNNPATATYINPTRTTPTGTTVVSYPGGGPDRVSVGLPDMTIAKSHVDPFVRGSTTATYTVIARNVGGAVTIGTVTVTDTLPAGLTPTAVSGTGWTCPTPAGQTVTCTRADALAAGVSYPPITVTVTVLATAASSLINQAVVSGGGETNTSNNVATDPTNIISLPGLPNTSGPSIPDSGSPFNLLLLAALGLIASVGVVATRSRPVRFRKRRRRPNLRAMSILLCLVAFTPASGMLLSPASAVSSRGPVATEATAEVIADTVVTAAKPAPPVEESFHVAAGPITPSRLRIPSIAVDAPVAGVGLLPDGSMAVPDNLWVSAWLSSGARPGQAGSAVIAGHRGISTPGLFGHLENVRAGDRIRVSDAGGAELVYQVTRVASLDLSTATQLQVFGPTTHQQLVLITCIGQYSRTTRTYDHRLVVFSQLLPAGA
jgi:LPXTG-site transpeptidase (sortase) family protein